MKGTKNKKRIGEAQTSILWTSNKAKKNCCDSDQKAEVLLKGIRKFVQPYELI